MDSEFEEFTSSHIELESLKQHKYIEGGKKKNINAKRRHEELDI